MIWYAVASRTNLLFCSFFLIWRVDGECESLMPATCKRFKWKFITVKRTVVCFLWLLWACIVAAWRLAVRYVTSNKFQCELIFRSLQFDFEVKFAAVYTLCLVTLVEHCCIVYCFVLFSTVSKYIPIVFIKYTVIILQAAWQLRYVRRATNSSIVLNSQPDNLRWILRCNNKVNVELFSYWDAFRALDNRRRRLIACRRSQ